MKIGFIVGKTNEVCDNRELKKNGIENPEDNFNKKSKAKDGLQPYCKLCINEQKKLARIK